jgi:hypothetical protein
MALQLTKLRAFWMASDGVLTAVGISAEHALRRLNRKRKRLKLAPIKSDGE